MQRLVLLMGAVVTLMVAGCSYERREVVERPVPSAVAVPPATVVTVP